MDELDIHQWVSSAQEPEIRELRQAVHTILSAISTDPELKASMILKGGILMAIRYHSHRYTRDIDLSTDAMLGTLDPAELSEQLNQSLAFATEALDYDLECRVQKTKIEPSNDPNYTFPSIKMTVGYAYKGTGKHKRLMAHQSPTVISIDYSFNEPTPNVEQVRVTKDDTLLAYSLTDLIAEKYRALLQQVDRDRFRRQDIFDLFLILTTIPDIDVLEKHRILDSLTAKAQSRNITATITSLDNPEVRRRAQRDYHTLADEIIGELPDFDSSFDKVRKFYTSLPWQP